MGLSHKVLKTAYLDCSSGISGDMFLGALVDAGVPIKNIETGLGKLKLKGYRLAKRRVKRAGLSAMKVDVELTAGQSPKRFNDIKAVIDKSTLSPDIKTSALNVFKRLFDAEARAHGGKSNDVHLHELGAVDCMIDIVGTLVALKHLGIKDVFSSPVNVGSGTVKTSHGLLPVPAPATAEMLKGVPVYSSGEGELTTPTGAALLKEVSLGFGGMPAMTLRTVGTGAGSKNLKDRPNVLRIFIGEAASKEGDAVVLETNIDDMDPRICEYVLERLLKEGALDVYFTQVVMKKGRPGIKLTVLCDEGKRDALEEIIFRETTTLGIRRYRVQRSVLEREIRKLDTEFGPVRIKKARLGGKLLRSEPEYEDCKKAAKKSGVPLREIIRRLRA
jgi:uncharacterized protein (TIGR00299 family) protein